MFQTRQWRNRKRVQRPTSRMLRDPENDIRGLMEEREVFSLKLRLSGGTCYLPSFERLSYGKENLAILCCLRSYEEQCAEIQGIKSIFHCEFSFVKHLWSYRSPIWKTSVAFIVFKTFSVLWGPLQSRPLWATSPHYSPNVSPKWMVWCFLKFNRFTLSSFSYCRVSQAIYVLKPPSF